MTTGSAREAGHTLLAVLHALRHAWDRRLVPAAGQGSGGSSSIEQLSMPVAVAEFLGSMAEEADRSRWGLPCSFFCPEPCVPSRQHQEKEQEKGATLVAAAALKEPAKLQRTTWHRLPGSPPVLQGGLCAGGLQGT